LRDLVRKLRTKHRLVTPDDRRRHPAEISGPQLSLFYALRSRRSRSAIGGAFPP
jgi:hypothetical protein